MFHAVGLGVMKLHRSCLSKLDLSMLLPREDDRPAGGNDEEGLWRILSDEEVWNCLGYRARMFRAK